MSKAFEGLSRMIDILDRHKEENEKAAEPRPEPPVAVETESPLDNSMVHSEFRESPKKEVRPHQKIIID